MKRPDDNWPKAMIIRAVEPIGKLLGHPARLPRMRHLPRPFDRFYERYAPRIGAWPSDKPPPIPDELKTLPGIRRDQEAANEAHRTQPLYKHSVLHPEATAYNFEHIWRAILPLAPRLMRTLHRARTHLGRPRAGATEPPNGAELRQLLRDWRTELGISAIGVAPYDERYTVEGERENVVGDRIIVCVLEQNYEASQTIPSRTGEKAVFATYAELISRMTVIADRLNDLGFRTRIGDPEGAHMNIHYAVEAGLGQLGLNGQLLTRYAGSRCRLITLETDAPIDVDQPKDFGVHAICDACKVCAKRCPSGAIPSTRKMHRGIEKVKINTSRCLPVVSQVDGCAICLKVCPVQKYGLDAVLNEFVATGRILGKGTWDLESYRWPLDGRLLGPEEKPILPKEFFDPGHGYYYDRDRTHPPEGAVGLFDHGK